MAVFEKPSVDESGVIAVSDTQHTYDPLRIVDGLSRENFLKDGDNIRVNSLL